jgi:glutamate racemase
MLAENIDTIVLGCTHYPFVIPLIQEIAGPGVRVIDPAPAVARQADRLLQAAGLQAGPQEAPGWVRIYTSADPGALQAMLPGLLGCTARVRQAIWQDSKLMQVESG